MLKSARTYIVKYLLAYTFHVPMLRALAMTVLINAFDKSGPLLEV